MVRAGATNRSARLLATNMRLRKNRAPKNEKLIAAHQFRSSRKSRTAQTRANPETRNIVLCAMVSWTTTPGAQLVCHDIRPRTKAHDATSNAAADIKKP